VPLSPFHYCIDFINHYIVIILEQINKIMVVVVIMMTMIMII